MWEDLVRRRDTEVDWLNGEIVRLAQSCGRDAPVNRRVVSLVHDVEARRTGPPNIGADALAIALGVTTGVAAGVTPGR
jgi:2-dehydropantoate 2-reductase